MLSNRINSCIKKIKAPIGDENQNSPYDIENLTNIKKIKAPIGDENFPTNQNLDFLDIQLRK